MKTEVTVEFFKVSGKFYSSLIFRTDLNSFDSDLIRKEAEGHKEFIKGMSFTIESISLGKDNQWGKYLYIIQ